MIPFRDTALEFIPLTKWPWVYHLPLQLELPEEYLQLINLDQLTVRAKY